MASRRKVAGKHYFDTEPAEYIEDPAAIPWFNFKVKCTKNKSIRTKKKLIKAKRAVCKDS